MKLKLGDSVVVRTASPFNGSLEHPGIVTRVWGIGDTRDCHQCVNVTVLPDCGAPFFASSVQVFDVKPDAPTTNQAWLPGNE